MSRLAIGCFGCSGDTLWFASLHAKGMLSNESQCTNYWKVIQNCQIFMKSHHLFSIMFTCLHFDQFALLFRSDLRHNPDYPSPLCNKLRSYRSTWNIFHWALSNGRAKPRPLCFVGRADGIVVIHHLALHQWVQAAGFNSHYGLYVQMVSQSMLALTGFLRDLRFPPAFKIGARVFITSKHPFTQGYWGAAVLKSGCYNLSADRIVAPNGLHAVAAKVSALCCA